jgi:hypothetical protein
VGRLRNRSYALVDRVSADEVSAYLVKMKAFERDFAASRWIMTQNQVPLHTIHTKPDLIPAVGFGKDYRPLSPRTRHVYAAVINELACDHLVFGP